jgi:DNA-binding NtrC family response regulator
MSSPGSPTVAEVGAATCGAGTGWKEQALMTGDAVETIIVIDDDYAMRLSCERILSKTGFVVQTFEDGARGLAAVAELRPALVLVDLKMPGLSGMEVIPRIREIDPNAVIVVITGYATIGTAVDAMKAGAYDFLPKPFSPDELRLIVRRGLERRQLELGSRQCEWPGWGIHPTCGAKRASGSAAASLEPTKCTS